MLCKYKNFFVLKQVLFLLLLLLWIGSLSYRYTVLGRLSFQSDKILQKIWKQGDYKNTNFPTLWQIGKIIEVQTKLSYIHETKFFIFFLNVEKLRSSARVTFKNPNVPLEVGKNLKVQPKTYTQISQFCIYGWI